MSQTPANLRGVLRTIDLRTCEADPDTLTSVISLAIEIAREGREGRRIGTILTVGAEAAVLQRSRCLILDPIAGHPWELLHLGDPNLRETIKELAQLDGGFVVSGSGHVLSACRYFESTLPETTQLLGLGTRHLAAASISATTGALAVVVSESSVVRIFSTGQLMTEILPELWLLSQYMPHIAHPTYTSDQEQNLAILSEPSLDRPTEAR